MNASDTRSKSSLRDHVREIIDNQSLSSFADFFQKVFGPQLLFDDQNEQRPAAKRQVLIMDEVDGMSSGDRGGMAELILLIKKTKVSRDRSL